eukprot:CAMPEP_0202118316 /NCGR_PEP_ID=MMETSP0965-20130614/43088_1 /ASSEMBLY_ACC=CAM_ASM_000507 /TAXON_ID=4773 /ORGANISM="Schizochytrium aggregatum, Strain ATCC28209" /LENGTH=604 /DNA_ID=CAMNT_0048688239 /DNA_START=55 /DNA_END=1869 /DNA_ORIENTATION=-
MRVAGLCAAVALAATTVAHAFDPIAVLDKALADQQDIDARTLMDSEGNPVPRRELQLKRKNNPYSSKFRVRSERSCVKPADDRNTEDRYCESNFKPASVCGCKEVCHIWGDPHVSPFFSGCSEVSMKKPGVYTLYQIPENPNWPDRLPIKIEGEVIRSERNKYRFVKKLMIDDRVVMSVADCKENVNTLFKNKYVILDNSVNQTLLTVESNCNQRHELHLNVTISLDNGIKGADDNDLATILSDAQQAVRGTMNADGVPESTVYFDDDFGVCTDPLKYSNPNANGAPQSSNSYNYGKNPFWSRSEECSRPSGLADGAECSCNQQCAAYGDPHMYDFPRKQELGNDFLANVKDPKNRVIYSAAPYYSAVVAIDECAYIRKFWAIYAKDVAVNANPEDPVNYHVVTYDASELCADESDVDPADRTKYFAPQQVVDPGVSATAAIDSMVYDPTVQGFNTGTFVKFDDNSVEPVPRSLQSNPEQFISIWNKSPNSIIETGGVQAVLKCHTTEDRDVRRYFNVCIERKGVLVRQPDDAARRLAGNDMIEDPNIHGLIGIERAIKSAGWCATGKEVRGGGYERRSANEVTVFPYNPEVALAEACRQDPGC